MAKEFIKRPVEEQSQTSSTHIDSIPRVPGGMIEQNEIAVPIEEIEEKKAEPSERRQIAKSATLVMLGNLGSSVMGMVRQAVVAAIGSSVAGPFNAALLPARTFNDLLVNGSVSGALIPTFNDYSAPEKRDELRRIVFTLVNLLLIITTVVAVLSLIISPYFIDLLVSGYGSFGRVAGCSVFAQRIWLACFRYRFISYGYHSGGVCWLPAGCAL